jgi:hypothetical protein
MFADAEAATPTHLHSRAASDFGSADNPILPKIAAARFRLCAVV